MITTWLAVLLWSVALRLIYGMSANSTDTHTVGSPADAAETGPPTDRCSAVLVLPRCCSNLLGNVYPAYASYKAVLSRDPEQHKQWLCYW